MRIKGDKFQRIPIYRHFFDFLKVFSFEYLKPKLCCWKNIAIHNYSRMYIIF